MYNFEKIKKIVLNDPMVLKHLGIKLPPVIRPKEKLLETDLQVSSLITEISTKLKKHIDLMGFNT